jgi:6-phosphogluconolactonase (cycloisomerase 2 family)
MKSLKLTVAVCLLAGSAFLSAPRALHAEPNRGAVFVMTNAATNNQVIAYSRQEDGSLQWSGAFPTGGNGSGGAIDPLHSQGSLILNADHRLLFAVNAGSGTISSFEVHGTSLRLVDTTPSGGSSPTALTQTADLLYVLNAGGNGNVSGFRVTPNGRLNPIHDSTKSLSGSATSPTALVLSPNRQFLVVAESATNNLDVFRVLPNGRLSDISVNASAGATPFALQFAPNGALIVANASNSVSSYWVGWNQSLSAISSELPTLGMATCWSVVLPNGRFVYTANAGSSTLSGFAIARNGSLTPVGATVAGTNPSGSTNLDTAVSADGKFVYTLNAGTGTIGVFSAESDGSLSNLGTVGGLAASSGLNGIAAY